MRKLFAVVALAPTLLLVAAAPAQDLLDQQVAKFTEALAAKGFSPTGWLNNGALGQGQETTVSVALKGGGVYGIVGVCDNDCGDLNLRLIDSGGNEVDNDLEDDDNPVLAINQSGSYTIKVSMVKCGSSKCRYRLAAYTK